MAGDPAVWVRPAGLGKLGSNSHFAEPYVIRSPHRVHVGDDVSVARGAFLSLVEEFGGERFDPVVRIGNGCSIGTDLLLHCAGEIDIGKHVAISARAYIGDSFRDYEDPTVVPLEMPMAKPEAVRICDGAYLGTGSAVLPGVTVGERAIISAGSVVTRDVPARTVVSGNPARVVRSWDEDAQEWRIGG
jgi:acetyltransferase-like isoleucine patch superfamily enzyme